tara:strand:- start:5831 stop:6166 length:336 start_codon:yes stop_codon:yes gene_type:complete
VSDIEYYLPIDALADTLSVKVNTIRTWVRQGFIPKSTYIKVANTYRFNVPQVIEALQKGKHVIAPPAGEYHVDEVTGTTQEEASDLGYEQTNAPKELSLEAELDLDENEDF